jgi:hypothetical protein
MPLHFSTNAKSPKFPMKRMPMKRTVHSDTTSWNSDPFSENLSRIGIRQPDPCPDPANSVACPGDPLP